MTDARTGGARPLASRTIVVSGASSGIGAATADRLRADGAIVHGLARRASSGQSWLHRCDVTSAGQVADVIAAIAGQDGLDAIVLAAGTNITDRSLAKLSMQGWEEVVATNLTGTFTVLHASLPYLRQRGGDIIMVASVSGLWPDASGAAYQASKAGQIGLARATALEEHQHGIRVSAVLPGLVDTPLLDRRPEPPGAELRHAALRPADVAEVCAFLLALPRHATIPELTILPSVLQALGDT
jgi:NAD(P)-dependent dehydrogenase (short-subunit alcohol dehydrogenase family)